MRGHGFALDRHETAARDFDGGTHFFCHPDGRSLLMGPDHPEYGEPGWKPFRSSTKVQTLIAAGNKAEADRLSRQELLAFQESLRIKASKPQAKEQWHLPSELRALKLQVDSNFGPGKAEALVGNRVLTINQEISLLTDYLQTHPCPL